MSARLELADEELKLLVGQNIRAIREMRGLSGAELAALVGKYEFTPKGREKGKRGYIYKLEKKGTLSPTVLKPIADALGVPYMAFFNDRLYSLRNMCDMLAQLAFICNADVRPLEGGGLALCIPDKPLEYTSLFTTGTTDNIATICILNFLKNIQDILPLENKLKEEETTLLSDDVQKIVEKAIEESTTINYADRPLEQHADSMKNSRLQQFIMETPNKNGVQIRNEQLDKMNELDNIYKRGKKE